MEGDALCDMAVQTLRRVSVQTSTDIIEADHCFVEDLGNPGEKISILAGMLGRVVAQYAVLTGKWYFVKYQRPKRRCVHFVIAPQFREKHQAMTDVIEGAARQDKNHWQQHDSLEALSGLADASLLAIVTNAEAREVEAKLRSLSKGKPQVRAAKVVTKPELRKFVCNMDSAASGR